jgi:hypothetical protein
MQIDEHTESVLGSPVDRSHDSRPRVRVDGRDGLEGRAGHVDRTERPVADRESDGVDA